MKQDVPQEAGESLTDKWKKQKTESLLDLPFV
jgi:hypothetical protein